jgi:mxaJ protein
MFLRCLSLLTLTGALLCASDRTLRVCADPNNLPFSSERQEGFETRVAAIIASALNAKLETVWWSERRQFLKDTLGAGRCDFVAGVPANIPGALTTRPYYRSTYVFVHPAALRVTSLDDPALRQLRIGLHIAGTDYTPPGFALADRGIVANVRGYSLFGTYGEANPPARLVEAVAKGDIDVAIVWGPLGGYFGRMHSLCVDPVRDRVPVPLAYEIAVGVSEGNAALRDEIDRVLVERRAEIERILDDFAVPRIAGGAP